MININDNSLNEYNFIQVKCNFCESDDYFYFGQSDKVPLDLDKYKKDEFRVSVVRCRKCGLVYPNPLPVASRKIIQTNYSKRDGYFDNELKIYKLNVYSGILKYLSKVFKTKGKLLDVGCGEGDFIETATAEGWDSFGIDISEDFVRYAKSRHLKVEVGEFNKLGLPENHFDVVIMYALLEHVIDPKSYLLEARRVLKDNGMLYLKVPNDNSILFTIGDIYKRLMLDPETTHLSIFTPPYHLYGFSQLALRKIFALLNFRILRMRVFNDGPSGFTRRATIVEKIESIGYALTHNFCGIINQGVSIEVYVMKK